MGGEVAAANRLNESQSAEIAKRYASGESSGALADEFGVTSRSILNHVIKQGVKPRTVAEENKRKAKPSGEAAKTYTYHRYKIRAKRNGIEFALSRDEFFDLINKDCHYCGAGPSNLCQSKAYNGSYAYNGLDRRDNRDGYVKDNVVPCCMQCNRAKNTLSIEEFFVWIRKIYEQQGSTEA
jgi:hypothetical protein